MTTWLQQTAGKIIGGTGKAISTVGYYLGNPLPERSISENLQRIGGMLNPVKSVSAAEYNGPTYQAPQSIPGTLGASTSNIPTNNTNYGGSQSSGGYDQSYQNVQSQSNTGLDLIEQDYNNALGALAGQEQSLRGQADVASQQIESEAGQARNQVGQQKDTAVTGIQGQQQTAETGAKTATQQARDLFRQTQQGNIAQLSALGISSSSVAEALAERLGVETARRIAGVTDNLEQVRFNAATELKRTNDYYQQKLTDIQNEVQVQKGNIQNSLLQGLNQINSARNQAASDKAQGRANLIANTQNAIAQLAQQAQQFEQSLKQWAAQKSSALTPIVTDPGFLQQLSSATSTFNQKFAPSGFQYAPQVDTNAYGNVQGNINYTLQKKPDELANPFATQ